MNKTTFYYFLISILFIFAAFLSWAAEDSMYKLKVDSIPIDFGYAGYCMSKAEQINYENEYIHFISYSTTTNECTMEVYHFPTVKQVFNLYDVGTTTIPIILKY